MAYTGKWHCLESCVAVEAVSLLLKQSCVAFWMMAGIMAAAPRYIGMATADGRLWVDSAGVSNHATLFEGSIVETEDAPAKLRLASGASVWLDVASRADVFQDHLLLQKGRAQLDRGAAFQIDAGTLRVTLASPESRAMVSVRDSGAVQVGALNGGAQVRNRQDVVVAQVGRGRPVELRLDSSGASLVTGRVSRLGKSMVLQDEVSGVTVELRGKDLNNYLGKRVLVSGAAAEPRATAAAQHVIQASALQVLGAVRAAPLVASTNVADQGLRERAGPGGPGAVLGGVRVAPSTGEQEHIDGRRRRHKPPISRGR